MIFAWLPILSVSHLPLPSPPGAVISTPVSPSGLLGPPGKPEAEFECDVESPESIGMRRLILLSFSTSEFFRVFGSEDVDRVLSL